MARRARQSVRRNALHPLPAPSGHAAAAARNRVACWTVSLLLVAGVALTYAQTYRHDFVNIDDDAYVTKNPYLVRGLTADGLAWAFTASRTANWHPLTWVSLLVDSQCYGTSFAGGYHLTNVLLHAANAVLLFLLLRRMTGQLWPSALVAALFAVHPARVESVAWVTERKDVLSGLFGLLTLWAYVSYARAPGVVRYCLVVLALALGLMAKSTLVTWPFLFLLLDYWPLRRPLGWRLLLEKVPLLVAVAGCGTAMFLMQRAGGAVVSVGAESIPARFARAALLYLSYLRISLWPANLSPYAIPEVGSRWSVFAAAGLLALATAGAIWAARPARTTPQPWLPVGWFWFLGTLVPTIGLVQVGAQVLADRFLYLPQIGLWIAVVWTSAAWAGSHPPRTWTLIAATAFVLVLFTVAAWRQTACWQNSETLWTQAIVCDEQNSDAHIFMGLALHEQHRDDLAEEHLRAAVRADPDSRSAYGSLGWLLEEKGNLDAAVRCYTEAIDHFKNAPEDEYSLGMVLWKKGDLRGAESHLTRAIELRGDFAQARVGLAQLRQRLGAGDEEVVRLCREALEIDPALAEAHVLLANSAARQGNMADAAEHLRVARDLAADAGQSDLAADIQRRLDRLGAGKAFHDGK